jgi:hypothetical protein
MTSLTTAAMFVGAMVYATRPASSLEKLRI